MSAHSYDNPRCNTSVSTILSSYPCDSELAGNIGLRLHYGVKDGEQKHRRDCGIVDVTAPDGLEIVAREFDKAGYITSVGLTGGIAGQTYEFPTFHYGYRP